MIRGLLYSFIFFELLLALSLSLAGVSHVDLGVPFMSFVRQVSETLDNWRIAIPNIPSIPSMTEMTGNFWEVIDVLISFFNGFIAIINIIIQGVNTIIQLIQFIFTCLYGVIAFKDTLVAMFVPTP